MSPSESETYVMVRFFPIDTTREYASTIPFSVKEKACELAGHRLDGLRSAAVEPRLWIDEIEDTFLFMLRVYKTRVALNTLYDIQRNDHFQNLLKKALIEYYEQK